MKMHHTGRVKWFDPSKGFGFIQPDDGGDDVFVHIKAVQMAGYTALVEGVRIGFDVVAKLGRISATNLRIG
jgi:cold shock protein